MQARADRFYVGKKVQIPRDKIAFCEPGWADAQLEVAELLDGGAVGVDSPVNSAERVFFGPQGLETWQPPTVDSMEPAPPEPAAEKALRFNEGKAQLSYVLMFGDALREFAKVCEKGAEKYERGNFTKGAPLSESIDAALRHLLAWQEGEDRCPESGCLHLAHAVWNVLRACQESIVSPERDDRVSYQKTRGAK